MAWIPSHQELRDHPKARKASRKAGVSLPQMVGHLHMLWWWALDHAPDGDLSKYDADDLADAAMWEGDPETLVKALLDCGPGGSSGFLTEDYRLHDWDEYGGKYGQRVESARKAAAARWQSDGNADAMRSHSGGTADAQGDACGTHAEGNAEESRGDKSRKSGARKRATQLPEGWIPNDTHRRIAGEVNADVEAEATQFRDFHTAKGSTFKDWDAAFRTWLRNARKYGATKPAQTNGQHQDVCELCGQLAATHDDETCEAVRAVG